MAANSPPITKQGGCDSGVEKKTITGLIRTSVPWDSNPNSKEALANFPLVFRVHLDQKPLSRNTFATIIFFVIEILFQDKKLKVKLTPRLL